MVVLPTEPVSPMTRPRKWERQARARSVMAEAVLGTSMMAAPSSRARRAQDREGASVTSAPAAPARRAASTNAWPSTRSPGRAT